MTVAQKLYAIITDRGTTYTHLSKKTGIPVNAISRSMTGKRKLPADEMVKICIALGIDLPDFLVV